MRSPNAGDMEPFAAIDLGSNSFHLLLARSEHGQLSILDRKKEMVRLAAGLDRDRNLSKDKEKQALDALKRMGQLLSSVPASNKRAVGTNTLRAARNVEGFLKRASDALGCPIDVIAGREEARLVYVGVMHSVQPSRNNQLVVDIGGGSTECIIGKGFEPQLAHSLRMGCVSYTQGFFPNGQIEEATLNAAIFAASNEVSTLEHEFLKAGFDTAIGSSGTIAAIRQSAIEEGWCHAEITEEALAKLRRYLTKVGRIDKIKLSGISERRAEVLPGGVAILSAIFDRLRVQHMKYSEGALREGVLYDLLGRVRTGDVRDKTVAAFQARYGVAKGQAERVGRRLNDFLEQAGESWELADEQWRRLGRWAAALHEVGLAINYPGHHKHGAYLIENSDMPGFSKMEQSLLAGLVLCHRRKFRHEVFENLPDVSSDKPARLAVLLRLAVRVERLRNPELTPSVWLEVKGRNVNVRLESNPGDLALLLSDLEAEKDQLARAKFKLSVQSSEQSA